MSNAMQWLDFTHGDAVALASAQDVVAWVQRNGGQAVYDIGYPQQYDYPGPTIAIRGADGEEHHCEPGQWVVKGDEPKREDCPHRFYLGADCDCIREFTVSADLPASVAGSAER